MNDSDLKALLAEAESHYSRYQWDEAIASFEIVLREHANHGAAAQGLADAMQQKQVEAELSETIADARTALADHRFTDALAALNHAQTRAAMRHILKYHAEIDGLRTQAQESLEWQRRVEMALLEGRRLSAEKQLDAALQVLDAAWHGLTGRGLEALGQELRQERERLWAERDLEQRIGDAETAFARQDYRLAHELAGSLSKDFPERAGLRRMEGRFALVWESVQSRLAAVHDALAAGRTDDAVALLGALRHDWPDNRDWRALWLKVQVDHGRAQMEAGRGAMGERRFDQAANAFAEARTALAAALDVFEQHPTAALERDEAEALYASAVAATQAARDGAAGRWDAAWRGWQASEEKLKQAMRVRGRDFGDVAAVIESMLSDTRAAVAALEQARLLLVEGQGALAQGDAGRARECFREGLSRAERDGGNLREQIKDGLRAADHAQREARALMARAERTEDDVQSLALLRRAHQRWSTAPGLADRLAARLLGAARRAVAAGDEEAAAAYCEETLSLHELTGQQQAEAEQLAHHLVARGQARAAVAEATRALAELSRQVQPSAAGFRQVLEILAAAPLDEVPELRGTASELTRQAQANYEQLAAAEPYLVRAEVLRQAGDWDGAVATLEEALDGLQHQAGAVPSVSPLRQRLVAWQAIAGGFKEALAKAGAALAEAEALYGASATGELGLVNWAGLAAGLQRAADWLAAPPPGGDPLPAAWTELAGRLDDLAQRTAVLHAAYGQVEAGHPVEALPALVQALAGRSRDPVLSTVLRRLQEQTAGEASAQAEALVDAGRDAIARGAMAEARQRLAEARLYASAAPGVLEKVAIVERQAAAIDRITQSVPAGGVSPSTAGSPAEALAACRALLELAASEDAVFPAPVRQDLHVLLGLEERLWEAGAVRGGEAVFSRLVDVAAGDPLVRNHLLAPLRTWWKLALRVAVLDFITAQLLVGNSTAAYRRAWAAFAADPRDATVRELFVRARQEVWAQRQADINGRVVRARRLAERGAYGEALAVVQGIGMPALAKGDEDATSGEAVPEAVPDGLVAALAEAGELRLDLAEAQVLAERLAPIAARVRAGLIEGRLDQSSEALEEASVVDPQRRCTVLWRDLEAMASLLQVRLSRAERARLEQAADRAETALEFCESAQQARAILEELIAAKAGSGALIGPEGERLNSRLTALKDHAGAVFQRLERLEAALASAQQAGDAGMPAQQMAALTRAVALARGRTLEGIEDELARLHGPTRGQAGAPRTQAGAPRTQAGASRDNRQAAAAEAMPNRGDKAVPRQKQEPAPTGARPAKTRAKPAKTRQEATDLGQSSVDAPASVASSASAGAPATAATHTPPPGRPVSVKAGANGKSRPEAAHDMQPAIRPLATRSASRADEEAAVQASVPSQDTQPAVAKEEGAGEGAEEGLEQGPRPPASGSSDTSAGGAQAASEPGPADTAAPATAAPAVEPPIEVEMLSAFDVNDWLSNVTPVAPEEDKDGSGSRSGVPAEGTR